MPVDVDLGPRRFRLAGGPHRVEPLLRERFASAGWVETRDDDFDLLWNLAAPARTRCREIDSRQRHSRIWGLAHLRHRLRRAEHLAWARLRLGPDGERLYDFAPRFWTLPDDAETLNAGRWIQRPLEAGGSLRAELLTNAPVPSLAEEYLEPHLLDGCKYLLRFFVLVSSLEPLELHLFREGLCRRALRPYSIETIGDRAVHQPGFGRAEPAAETPRTLSACIRDAGLDGAELFTQVRQIVALTLLAARGDVLATQERDAVPHDAGFELLAFDILVDAERRARLLDIGFGFPFDEDSSAEELAVERDLLAATLATLGVPLDGAGFEPILPSARAPELLAAYEVPRYDDLQAWRRLVPGSAPPLLHLVPDGVVAHDLGERIVLLDCKTGNLVVLDRAGAEIWRAVSAGQSPTAITDALAPESRDREATERDVWNTLAAWTQTCLLRRAEAPPLAVAAEAGSSASLRFAAQIGDELQLAPDTPGRLTLPTAGASRVVIRRRPGPPSQARLLTPDQGIQLLITLGLRADPGLSESRARELLSWLAGLSYVDEIPIPPDGPPPRLRADVLAEALEILDGLLRRHQIWYSLAYGSLLGALRDGDVIPWDYDLDLMVRGEDLWRILPLSGEDGCVFTPIRRKGTAAPFNPAGLDELFISAVLVEVRGRTVGELYSFSLFSDGVMRRFHPASGVYWWPHSSFPHFLVEQLTTLPIRGRPYPAPLHAEKWIEINYGADWRTPYRARTQGGHPRPGSTDNSDRYEPRLREHIAWCEARGWDRTRYRDAHPWPQPIAACGPFGATPRTRRGAQAMWYRTLDEVLHYY